MYLDKSCLGGGGGSERMENGYFLRAFFKSSLNPFSSKHINHVMSTTRLTSCYKTCLLEYPDRGPCRERSI
jgi:hypothetical protein